LAFFCGQIGPRIRARFTELESEEKEYDLRGHRIMHPIYAEDDLPEDQQKYLELNGELSALWPVITEQQPHFDDAKDWEEVKDKHQHLER